MPQRESNMLTIGHWCPCNFDNPKHYRPIKSNPCNESLLTFWFPGAMQYHFFLKFRPTFPGHYPLTFPKLPPHYVPTPPTVPPHYSPTFTTLPPLSTHLPFPPCHLIPPIYLSHLLSSLLSHLSQLARSLPSNLSNLSTLLSFHLSSLLVSHLSQLSSTLSSHLSHLPCSLPSHLSQLSTFPATKRSL